MPEGLRFHWDTTTTKLLNKNWMALEIHRKWSINGD